MVNCLVMDNRFFIGSLLIAGLLALTCSIFFPLVTSYFYFYYEKDTKQKVKTLGLLCKNPWGILSKGRRLNPYEKD